MNKRTAAKIFIDASMLVLYIQLTFLYIHNTVYHEVMGILIGVVFVIHVAMNAREAKALIARKKFASLAMDALLLVSMVVCIVTGLLVAKDLFVGPGDVTVAWVHTIAAYVGLVAIAGHLAQHAKYLASVVGAGKKEVAAAAETVGIEGAPQYTRRDFAKKAALAGAGVFAVASSVALGAPTLGKLSKEEDEPVATYAHAGRSSESESGDDGSEYEEPSQQSAPVEAPSSMGESADTSDVICTLCKKRCPLSSLQCQRGVEWATESGYL